MTWVILTFDLDPGNPKGTYTNFNAGSIPCITFMPSFFNVVLVPFVAPLQFIVGIEKRVRFTEYQQL